MTATARPLLRSLRRLAVIQLIVGLTGALLAGVIGGLYQGASFATGAGLIWANMLALAWTWWRLIEQKTIAWTALIIVIKYAVLLSSIFYLTRTAWFDMILAGLGIASFTIAALIWAVTNKEKENA